MKKQTKTATTKHRTKKPKTSPVHTRTFGEHLAELCKRVGIVGFYFLLGSILAYVYRQELLQIILAPLQDEKLVYLTPGGGFSFIFQVSIYAGLVFAAPVLVYQLLAFIRPALPAQAHHSMLRVVLLATLLMGSGIAYGYYVAIPAAIQFLSTFAEGAVIPNLTAESYLSFFLAYTGGLALLSLIPLVVMFWHWISPMKPGGILKSEQWVVLLAFALAAMITPTPDVFNQAMIAGPIIALYQIGVVRVLVDIARTSRREKKARELKSVQPWVDLPSLAPAESLLTTQQPTKELVTAYQQPAEASAYTPIATSYPRQYRSTDGVSVMPRRSYVNTRPLQVVDRKSTPPSPRRAPRVSIDGFALQ